MAILKEIASKAQYLKSVIDYVKRDAKTNNGYYVEGINCNPQKATAEFIKIQQLWDKTDGRRYFHYVMSWDSKDNITPELALEIVQEWISKISKLTGHQILLAAHLDQRNGNIHVHIVGNSVNMETGVKMHRNASELAEWKTTCNEINLKFGFKPPKRKNIFDKRKNQTTWTKKEYHANEKAHKAQKKSLKEFIFDAVINASKIATCKDNFVSILAGNGIIVAWNDDKRNITYTASDYEADTTKRTIRDSNLEQTFGFKCNKDSLEVKFRLNGKRQQVEAKEDAAKQASEQRRTAIMAELRKKNEAKKAGAQVRLLVKEMQKSKLQGDRDQNER